MLTRNKTAFNTSRNANYLKKYRETKMMCITNGRMNMKKKNRLVGLTGFVVLGVVVYGIGSADTLLLVKWETMCLWPMYVVLKF